MTQRGGEDGGREHSLSLRVMRLTMPTFGAHHQFFAESADVCGDVLQQQRIQNDDGSLLSQSLALPSNFGTIFLGDVFASYISVCNTSPYAVSNLAVKIELNAGQNRHVLLESPSSRTPALKPSCNKEFIVRHAIVEEGVHHLICTVQYTRQDGERKPLRKVFKFKVEKLFGIKQRNEFVGDRLFVELQVQNSSKSTIHIDRVTFEPIESLQYRDLNEKRRIDEEEVKDELSALGLWTLKGGHQLCYLYEISGSGIPVEKFRSIGTVGVFGITWTKSFGASSKQQFTVTLQGSTPDLGLSLSLTHCPAQVLLERPFVLQCTLVNTGATHVVPRLVFVRNKMDGIMANGVSGKDLGELPMQSSVSFPISFFPVRPGVHKINGIRVINQTNNSKTDFDNVLTVHVEENTA